MYVRFLHVQERDMLQAYLTIASIDKTLNKEASSRDMGPSAMSSHGRCSIP